MEKDNFETLALNKINFMKELALDDALARCMINNVENFKTGEVTQAQKYNLMYNQIFPHPKVMENITDAKSYITMQYKYKAVKGTNIFKTAYITFFIFCDESLIHTAYMVNRFDYMLQCVDRLINDTRGQGWLGKMAFDTSGDVVMDSKGKYIGVSVTYKNTEFQ